MAHEHAARAEGARGASAGGAIQLINGSLIGPIMSRPQMRSESVGKFNSLRRRSIRGPRRSDVSRQTRTLAAQEPDATAHITSHLAGRESRSG